MNDNAQRALEAYQNFEGMLGRLDATVIVALLEYQDKAGVEGDIAEFGVYKGKSAALFPSFLRADEVLHLADIHEYLMVDEFRKLTDKYIFHKLDSATFVEGGLGGKASPRFRIIHSDGSHEFKNVYNDIAVADRLLSKDGIMILDDYFNPYYPQVPAAIYTYLAREKTDLRVFLLGSNKCYLCRASAHDAMLKFAMRDFADAMVALSCPVTVAKTDRNELFDAVSYVGAKNDADYVKVYGDSLYGHYFKRKFPGDR